MNPRQNVNLQPSRASHQSQMPPQVHNQINTASLPLSNQMMGMFPMGELLWLCTKASPHDLVDPSIAWPIPIDFPLPEYGEFFCHSRQDA